MPAAQPALPPTANGHMSLEDFRVAVAQLQNSKPGSPMMKMKSSTWTDGTVKAVYFTVDATPEPDRARLVQEVSEQLMTAP